MRILRTFSSDARMVMGSVRYESPIVTPLACASSRSNLSWSNNPLSRWLFIVAVPLVNGRVELSHKENEELYVPTPKVGSGSLKSLKARINERIIDE